MPDNYKDISLMNSTIKLLTTTIEEKIEDWGYFESGYKFSSKL